MTQVFPPRQVFGHSSRGGGATGAAQRGRRGASTIATAAAEMFAVFREACRPGTSGALERRRGDDGGHSAPALVGVAGSEALVHDATATATATLPPSRNGRHVVLAIGAHPDDLELGCGGTLARMTEAGYEVHAIVMSNGQVGGNADLRPSEARAGGELLRLASLQVLDFPDTELGLHNVGLVKAIEVALDEVQPSLVMTHSEHDHHQDHHAVHLATLRAARHHPSILCFESPSTTRGFSPSLFVDIANYLDVKVRAVQLHADQSGKPYMGADRIRGIAAFRGGQAKKTFAEGFEVIRMLDTIPGGML